MFLGGGGDEWADHNGILPLIYFSIHVPCVNIEETQPLRGEALIWSLKYIYVTGFSCCTHKTRVRVGALPTPPTTARGGRPLKGEITR